VASFPVLSKIFRRAKPIAVEVELGETAGKLPWLDRKLWVRFSWAVQRLIAAASIMGAQLGLQYLVIRIFNQVPRVLLIAHVFIVGACAVIEARLLLEAVRVFLPLPGIPVAGLHRAITPAPKAISHTKLAPKDLLDTTVVRAKMLHKIEDGVTHEMWSAGRPYYEDWVFACSPWRMRVRRFMASSFRKI
jgi:hypothetical protein